LPRLLFLGLLITFSFAGSVQPDSPQYKALQLGGGISIGGGTNVIGKFNNPSSLKGWWNFNDNHASDQSGHRNNMYPIPAFGPQSGGQGYSGNYNFSNYSNINHIDAYDSNEFTVSFWIYLLQDSVGVWRTIIHKGSKLSELTPTVQLWPNENRLHVRVSTTFNSNEGLDSNGGLTLGRWTHIAVIVTNQLLQLFLNGQLDNQIILQGPVVLNKGPIHVGGDPWHPGVGMYLDDLRFYDTAVKQDVFIAWVEQFIPVYGGNFYAALGCPSCNYYEATNSCPSGYQLCSMPELYVGGYLTARIQGWFRNNIDLWVRVDLDKINAQDKKVYEDPNVYKMGVCCQL